MIKINKIDLTRQIVEYASIKCNKTSYNADEKLTFAQIGECHSIGSNGGLYAICTLKEAEETSHLFYFNEDSKNCYKFIYDSFDLGNESMNEYINECLSNASDLKAKL